MQASICERIEARWIRTKEDEEALLLYLSTIKSAYCYKYVLKKFYKKTSVDREKFNNLCNQLKTISKEAMIECMFGRVALKNIKMLADTYFEFNLKEERQSEKRWYCKTFTLTLAHQALKKNFF